MATRRIVDLFDCKTLHIIGGSQEFFFLSLYSTNMQGVAQLPLNLSDVAEIEWLFAPFSVIREKSTAIAVRTLSAGDITILRDGSDGQPNLIQVIIEANITQGLQGAFLHQIAVTDGNGVVFVPFEGVINVNRRIQT